MTPFCGLCLMNHFLKEFSTLAGGHMNYSQLFVNSGNCSACTFSVGFPLQPWVFFLPVYGDQHSVKYLRYHFHKYPDGDPSCLAFFPEDSSHLFLHERDKASELGLWNSVKMFGSNCVRPPFTTAWNYIQIVSWCCHGEHLICFNFLRNHLLCNVWKPLFHIFCPLL